MNDNNKDRLFASGAGWPQQFHFNDDVATVFNDMIRRSVPGYGSVVSGTLSIAERFLQPNTRCYDLGCSLGAVSLALSTHLDVQGAEIIAIDNAWSMISRLHEVLENSQCKLPVRPICGDIRDVRIQNASLVTLNFTLQFVPLFERDAMIKKIYEGLVPGGALVLAEKIELEDSDGLIEELHYGFKRVNGYSELEISRKRSALEQVLVPETLAQHEQRLRNAGFQRVEHWFRCFNFAAMLAIK